MEKGTMARRSKREYLASIQARYQRAGRAEKTAILDEFTTVCGYYHRKDALRLLHQSAPASSRPRRRVARRPRYSEEVISQRTPFPPFEVSKAVLRRPIYGEMWHEKCYTI